MNPLLKARQDALDNLLSQARELPADASKADMDSITNQIRDAREANDSAKAMFGSVDENDAYLNGNGNIRSIGAMSDDEALAAATVQQNRDRAIGTRMEIQERSGTELYGRTEAGSYVPKNSEGWGLTPKQFKSISEPVYGAAFERLLRGTADANDYKSALNEGNDGQGGYLAPPEFQTEVIMRRPHPTSILKYIRMLPCMRDRVIFPKINYTTDDIFTNPARIQWIGELGPTPAITDTSFGDVEIPIFTGQFPFEVSRNLLEDSAVPVGPLIAEFASQAYQLGMDNIVVNGTGVGQPAGILQNPGGTNEPPTVNIGNPVTADGLTTLVYGLPPQYQDNAVGLMNFVDAFMTFAKIKDSANHYVFGLQSTFDGGLATPRKPELFGKDVIFSAFMPNGGSAAKVTAYGDLRETFLLAQRVGLSVLPYGDQDKSMIAANKVGWMFRFRAGGDVVQGRALRVGVQS